jgi:dihydrofolate reductase
MSPKLSLIWAQAANGIIGKDNQLPWRLSADLARFKQLTLGHTLLMGRKTYESIGKPLPKRVTVVLTRQTAFVVPSSVHVVRDWDSAMQFCRLVDEIFVAGGAELYALALPHADKLYVTRIEHDYEGDTRFPEVDWKQWRKIEDEPHAVSESFPYAFRFETYERIR